MLEKCPECELMVSDKAITCPHCGNPLHQLARKRAPSRTKKRPRLPNGFGQISEIKGLNLRKPFRAMVTVGKTPTGRPIVKPLKPESYFESYNEAYAALVEYNKNPYDLSPSLSVQELYDKWTDSYFQTLTNPSSIRTIESAWKYCSSIYTMRASDVRARHMKGCMDDGFRIDNGEKIYPTAGIKARMKSLFNLMFDYAVEYEIAERNYARTFNISDEVVDDMERQRRAHIAFSADELATIWKHRDDTLWADVLLYQCYSGWRPQELGLLKLENVHLNDGYIIGGIKTDAGKERVVPIHPEVRLIIERHYEKAVALGSEFLFNCTDTKTHRSSWKLTYDKYKKRHDTLVENFRLNPEHRAHDGRMTFITLAKKYKMDEYAIKYIVGHKIGDITERVYTEREISWLCEEMKKIKPPVENEKPRQA